MTNKDSEISAPETKSISTMPSSVVQAVYKEMLDTSESLSKSFKPGKKVERDDIKFFCERFQQTCQQYQIKGLKSKFTIRRDEDHTEKFSSLDRFLASDAQGGQKTAALVVELQFLIKPPGYEKYQEYKAILSIDSTNYDQDSGTESYLLNMVGVPSFVFSIDYVDYAVARTFISMAVEWHRQLEDVKASPILDWIKKRFNPFVDIGMYSNLIALVAVVFSSWSSSRILGVWRNEFTGYEIAKFGLFAFLVIYTTRSISIILFNIFVKQIGQYRIPNFVVLNSMDRANVNRYEQKRKGIFFRSALSVFGMGLTVSLNIIAAHIFINYFS